MVFSSEILQIKGSGSIMTGKAITVYASLVFTKAHLKNDSELSADMLFL